MSTPDHRVRGARPASLLVFLFVVGCCAALATTASAQPRCAEPDDALYIERMADFPRALEEEDFAVVVSILDWATTRYRYSPHLYARARALHRLGREAEAEIGYSEFLEAFAGCDDPQGLADRARAFRDELATRRLEAERLRQPPPPEPGVHPGTWTALLGGAVLASGVLYDVLNRDLLEERDAARLSGDPQRIVAANDSLSTARSVDWALYGIGGAAVAIGITWSLVDSEEQLPAQVGFVPRDGGGTVSLSGPF